MMCEGDVLDGRDLIAPRLQQHRGPVECLRADALRGVRAKLDASAGASIVEGDASK